MEAAQECVYENTVELILAAQQGDMEARETLMRENSPLVRSIIKRYMGRMVDYDDLFQIGSLGLMKAIQGFDPSFGVRLSTYAVPLIHGELKRYIRDNNTVKMPRSLKEMQVRVKQCHEQLCSKLGREPGVQEIAAELACDLDEVLSALESLRTPFSLDEPIFEEGGGTATYIEMLENQPAGAALPDLLTLKECIGQLEPREQKIIALRYFKNYTQTHIARIMGLSQVQISRLETKILQKLRTKMVR